MKNILLVSILSILGFGCSEGGGGGNSPFGAPGAGLPELTKQQEEQVGLVAGSYSEISNAVSGQNVRSGVVRPFEIVIKARTSDKVRQKLQKAINEQRCQSNTKSSQTATSESQTETINGTNCPIDFKSEISMSTDQSGTLTANSTDDYLAKSGMEIHQATDVYRYNLVGNGTQVVSASSQTSQTVTESGAIKGIIYSKTIGEVASSYSSAGTVTYTSVDGNFSESGTREQIVDMTFPSFRVVGVITTPVEDPKNAKYKVNGRDVTAEEFSSLFGLI